MQRRLALTLAGSAAIVVAASSAAMAANLGLLGSSGPASDKVGNLDAANVVDLAPAPSTATTLDGQPEPVVVYVDEYVTAPTDPTTTEAPDPAPTRTREREVERDDARRPAPTVAAPAPTQPAPTTTTAPTRHEDDSHESEDHSGHEADD